MINFANICKLFLFVLFIGSITGCAELKELRGLNERQTLTIRDQTSEITQLKETNDKLSQELLSDEEEKERLRNELEKLAKAIGEGAIVRDTIEGPVILLQEKVLFDAGLAEIKKGGEEALLKIAAYLKERQTALLRIDGHTDADPIVKTKHLWDSNHHLSAARALSVFHFLTKREEIPSEMIHISGFGPNRSIASNETKEGKKANRRVEFLIVKGTESE
ncbi:MAG: OmpA family protein [Candidatus Anammoxibacter sp.]